MKINFISNNEKLTKDLLDLFNKEFIEDRKNFLANQVLQVKNLFNLKFLR